MIDIEEELAREMGIDLGEGESDKSAPPEQASSSAEQDPAVSSEESK